MGTAEKKNNSWNDLAEFFGFQDKCPLYFYIYNMVFLKNTSEYVLELIGT